MKIQFFYDVTLSQMVIDVSDEPAATSSSTSLCRPISHTTSHI